MPTEALMEWDSNKWQEDPEQANKIPEGSCAYVFEWSNQQTSDWNK